MSTQTTKSIEKCNLDGFYLAGISIISENGLNAQEDIGRLWQRFQEEKIAEKIKIQSVRK